MLNEWRCLISLQQCFGVIAWEGILHSLSLEEIEDVALGSCSDVQPDTVKQSAQGAASWEVRAPPNVQPPTQHLGHTNRAQNMCHHFSTFG